MSLSSKALGRASSRPSRFGSVGDGLSDMSGVSASRRPPPRESDLESTPSKRKLSFENLVIAERPSSASKTTGDPDLMWSLMSSYIPSDCQSIMQSVVNHVEYTLARTRYNFDNFGCYQAASYSVRDRLIESWNDTQQHFIENDAKCVYYLSMEFLVGRHFNNTLLNIDLSAQYKEALQKIGYRLEDLAEEERDPGLGNGGLGRLAACYMDSMATLNYPCWGYGIRYKYGMFEQLIRDGYQAEIPDMWLTRGNPWEIERQDIVYPIRFYGTVSQVGSNTDGRCVWDGGEIVHAMAYDMPVPGYDTWNTNNMRMWSSKPSQEFDLNKFNEGNYMEAIRLKERSETISSVLYPNDSSYQGKELRLKQQYFFVSATLQDIIHRFHSEKENREWSEFSELVQIQLNDTHPTIGVAELMRLLVDEWHVKWSDAWLIVTKTFNYTNHTVLPEALEKWSVELMESLLPRHMQIIYQINFEFLQSVNVRFQGDIGLLQKLSIIEEGGNKMVRMAHLAIVGSKKVNGVAEIHSDLLKTNVFPAFYKIWPEKFINVTNGVTPRRWILSANPLQSALMTEALNSEKWLHDMTRLSGLAVMINNSAFVSKWAAVKRSNKERLCQMVESRCFVKLDPDSLFDVQVKRIHEYKRQLLNILWLIYRYLELSEMPTDRLKRLVPRNAIFGGKAAPGYTQAKLIIKLINAVASVVNRDPRINTKLKVVFIPNYNVSAAEVIIPANDLSEHISTAGLEASGTGNMKFVMNSGLIIGTMDGANIEIAEEVGKENMFIFGTLKDDVESRRHEVRFAGVPMDPRLQRVISALKSGMFGDYNIFAPIVNSICNGNDYYLVTVDFASYVDQQLEAERVFGDHLEWTRRTIIATSRMAKFSSDRSCQEYAEKVWDIKPYPRPYPDILQSISTPVILEKGETPSAEEEEKKTWSS